MGNAERVKTGVEGLDEMLRGGLVKGRPYIVAGGPGAGKTILTIQFLLEGVKSNEKSLFIALEESADQLKNDMVGFKWDLSRIKILDTRQEISSEKWVIKTGSVVSKPEFTVANLIKIIKEKLDTYKPTRLVIDSITSVRLLYDKEYVMRRELLALMNFLYASDCTALLTSEVNIHDPNILMEEFLSSGVIKLHRIETKGERISAISIDKLRGSDFDKYLRPMKITEEGIVVFPSESIFE